MYLWLELSIAFDASLREKGHVFEASVQFFVWFLVQQPHKKSPCIMLMLIRIQMVCVCMNVYGLLYVY